MPVIDEYLKEVLTKKGSDLHFLAGDPPRIRLYGDLQPLRPERLEKEFVQKTLYEIMPKTARRNDSRNTTAPTSPTTWASTAASA